MAGLDVVVPPGLDGVRVDRALALLTERSRSEITGLVTGGGVRLDGTVLRRGSHRLRVGQRLEVGARELEPRPGPTADPTVAFDVVFADETVVVVDKPAGLVVHPGAGHREGTLVHGLLARFPDLAVLAASAGEADRDRPGIVHRLDRGTSGLLVVARTKAARDDLVSQLASRRVDRRYRSLVHGSMASPRGVVDAPVGRSTRDPTRMAVTRRGRPARTGYEVERRFTDPPATLLQLSLETGRTHQIRVHLAAIGHPVVGDDVYGRGRHLEGTVLAPDRPFLHAEALTFADPATGEARSFRSALPGDLAAELDRLGAGEAGG